MLSPRLPLWRVLIDEFESFLDPDHDPQPLLKIDCSFAAKQIKDAARLALRLQEPEDETSARLREKLNSANPELAKELDEFDGSKAPSNQLQSWIVDQLNRLLKDPNLQDNPDYDEKIVADTSSVVSIQSLPDQNDRLQLFNRLLLEETYADEIESINSELVKECYRHIHSRNHSALCLSGGGIRSATFNLGILQGLARHGLLEQFDYLSTVSGGGYAGGWLSAWIHRQGLEKVVRQLSEPPQSPVEPEPKPIVYLRNFSNYLSPRVGLLSADTWTMVATLLRNIILNWLVFVPVLIALLMLPRMWLAFLNNASLNSWALAFKATFGFSLSLALGSIAQVVALTYIGLNLPSSGPGQKKRHPWIPLLVPLVISAMAFATFWARKADRLTIGWAEFVLYAEALVVIPAIVCFGYRLYKAENRLNTLLQILGAIVLIGIAQFILGWIAWWGATQIPFFKDPSLHPILYSCLAVPLILGLLLLSGTFISGLTSRYTEDDDQEWWARSGAGIYIVIIVWIVFFALVLYGPYLFVWLGSPDWRAHWIARVGTAVGVISGAISLFGGFSGKTPANEQGAKKAGGSGIVLQTLTSLLGPIFLAFIFILLSFTAQWLLTLSNSLGTELQSFLHIPSDMVTRATTQYPNIVQGILLTSSLRFLVALFLLLAGLGALMSRAISTNKFSLHFFWRNRIIRAYLGASHEPRQPNSYTGFDTEDNVYMHELRPFQPGSPVPDKDKPAVKEKKLLHVLNIALNVAESDRLAWQERKAESFTVSPLHAGNYVLGYRKAMDYGRQPYNGKQGISLGTAVAISGAFASPNMGYMMSSSVIRFLMTLFNVRFGWWLGNPGRAGDNGLPFKRTYDRDSPRLSMFPIFQEALGMTDDQAPYVYLSDGGHFENLGLYEMVLRRCRLIVLGDGSSDGDYTFQSLGLAIRQIRIDLGVPIEFDEFNIADRTKKDKGSYCAIGTIRYSCVDEDAQDGYLILIKATLLGNEPRDVRNYASEHEAFPQEFIGDQWFSESQFESYRALGSHIIDVLCGEKGKPSSIPEHFDNLDEFKGHVANNLSTISKPDILQRALEYIRGNGK